MNEKCGNNFSGYGIEPAPRNKDPRIFYRRKARDYAKVARAVERKAKAAGRDSEKFRKYIKLLETSNRYAEMARSKEAA